MSPQFTILLTTHNSGHFIKKCLDSVLAQTYPHFNVFIFDDHSTDGTLEWLQQIEDNRVQIFPSDKNLGIEKNWARFTSVTKNEFCTILGHDDILYPDFLANIVLLIGQYPGAALYHTHFNFINAKGKIVRHSMPMPTVLEMHEFAERFFQRKIESMGTGYVMRSKAYDALSGIPQYPNLLFADFALWLRMMKNGPMAVSDKTSFAFRVHESVTSSSGDEKMHQGFFMLVNEISDLSTNNDALKNVIQMDGDAFLFYYLKFFSHRLLRTPKKLRTTTVPGLVEQFQKQAEILSINNYHPEHNSQIKLAKAIDQNGSLSYLFGVYKKMTALFK